MASKLPCINTNRSVRRAIDFLQNKVFNSAMTEKQESPRFDEEAIAHAIELSEHRLNLEGRFYTQDIHTAWLGRSLDTSSLELAERYRHPSTTVLLAYTRQADIAAHSLEVLTDEESLSIQLADCGPDEQQLIQACFAIESSLLEDLTPERLRTIAAQRPEEYKLVDTRRAFKILQPKGAEEGQALRLEVEQTHWGTGKSGTTLSFIRPLTIGGRHLVCSQFAEIEDGLLVDDAIECNWQEFAEPPALGGEYDVDVMLYDPIDALEPPAAAELERLLRAADNRLIGQLSLAKLQQLAIEPLTPDMQLHL